MQDAGWPNSTLASIRISDTELGQQVGFARLHLTGTVFGFMIEAQ
jgi:hypothetical protein